MSSLDGNMRSKGTLVVVLLLGLLLTQGFVPLFSGPVQASGREIYVDDSFHYPRDGSAEHPLRLINEALTVANDGDTIYVYGGNYNETLVVTKRVSIIGSIDDGITYIEKIEDHGYTVDMAANFSSLENVTVRDPGHFVTLVNGALIRVSAHNVIVQKNTCQNASCWGIRLEGGGDNTIVGNTMNLTRGISIQASDNNVFSNNLVINSTEYGISLINVRNNILYNNTVQNCSYGIYARTTQNLNLTNNTITHALIDGIYLYQDQGSILRNNTLSNNSGGMLLSSTNGKVIDNKCYDNQFGISFSLTSNLVQGNVVYRSMSAGIKADSWSRSNIIIKNHLVNNSPNARDYGSNTWDYNGSGNYWGDYRNIDRNHDGVGEVIYYFPGGRDNYPLGNFLKAPQKPCWPSPVDDKENVGLKVHFWVRVNDSDSQFLTVYFFNAANDELIGTARSVRPSTNATCQYTLAFDTTFAWYAISNDSLQENRSNIWFFTTRQRPPLNKKPIADAGGPYRVRVGQTFALNGSKSYDPDSNLSLLFYRWNFGDGTSEILAETPQHNYTSAGTYTVVLTVVDRDGRSNLTSTTVTVSGALADNKPPIPVITPIRSTRTNTFVIFNATGSSDTDGLIVAYRWDFNGDNIYESNWSSSATSSYVYSHAGSYMVRLQVKDDTDAVNSTTTSVLITAPPKKSPGFEVVGVLAAVIISMVLLRKRQEA
jgi:parallel beta-helix repeat protein